eukprot:tig00000042_g15559.t1
MAALAASDALSLIADRENGRRTGDPQPRPVKISVGCAMFCVVLLIIWGDVDRTLASLARARPSRPLLIFSTGNPIMSANLVTTASARLSLATGEGLYQVYVGEVHNAPAVSDEAFLRLQNAHPNVPWDSSFRGNTQLLRFPQWSLGQWEISPPARAALVRALNDSAQALSFTFTGLTSMRSALTFLRGGPPSNVKVEVTSTGALTEEMRRSLLSDVPGTALPPLVPRFLRLQGQGQPQDLDPQVVAVSDPIPTGVIGETLASIGLSGLYVTFVLGVSRFLRLFLSQLQTRIMYEDIPEPADVWQLCLDIYAARQARPGPAPAHSTAPAPALRPPWHVAIGPSMKH